MAEISVPITEYKELHQRAQKADALEQKLTSLEETKDRLEQGNRMLRELLKLERIKKYKSKSKVLKAEKASIPPKL